MYAVCTFRYIENLYIVSWCGIMYMQFVETITKGIIMLPTLKIKELFSTEFYVKNIAFVSIYEEYSSYWRKQSEQVYDIIYLEIKKEVTDYTTERGSKYKKKDATQEEIRKEMKTHIKYPEFEELDNKAEEFSKKSKTQKEFLTSLGKLDQILRLLQNLAILEKNMKEVW